MSSFVHALNIATLATWLSVSAAGTIAWALVDSGRRPIIEQAASGAAFEGPDLSLEAAVGVARKAETPVMTSVPPGAEEQAFESVEIPEIPEVMDLPPLPEIPEFPVVDKALASSSQARPPASARSPQKQVASTSGSSEKGGASSSGSRTGSSNASRWVGGGIPKPAYPRAAKLAGQEGRVVVFFTVDEQGNVVSASVTGPCPFPLLNEEARRAVLRGKFQPGPRASQHQTVLFQLN